MNDVIFETVVTTVAPDGRPHVAPMGVRYQDGQVVLMPFKPSTTLDNIVETGHAVLNLLTDTRVFAGCVTGRKQWPVKPAEQVPGVRLACALGHVELRLASRRDDAQRPVLHMARVHEVQHAPFIGFNRAQAAVLEGAVLVSRLGMLPAAKVDAEMAYLQIAIDKTAGPEEREAWGWLHEAIARHRAGGAHPSPMPGPAGGSPSEGVEAAAVGAAKPLPATQVLVSVRSVEEALQAAEAGVDFIDLKEPKGGALGGLPLDTLAAIVRALRAQGHPRPVSATIGDLPMTPLAPLLERVAAVAACGVDYVKVGITHGPEAAAVIEALAAGPHTVIPVFIADDGVDPALVAQACRAPFPALMLDTADKRAGSLFDAVTLPVLQAFVIQVREAGKLAGLAGALRLPHLPAVLGLTPDFAGFRSAVCAGERSGLLDPLRLQALLAAMRSSNPSHAAPARPATA